MNLLKKIEQFTIKKILKRLVSQKCPIRIPRSGDAGAKIKCYSSVIAFSKEKQLLIDNINNDGVSGLWLNAESDEFNIEGNMPFDQITFHSIRTRHYYGYYETRYSDLWDIILFDCTKVAIVKIEIRKLYDSIMQFFFNRKSLVNKKRFEILNILFNKHVEEDNFQFNRITVMSTLCSVRWFRHPEAKEEQRRVQLYLDSFLKSGEIEQAQAGTYKLTSKALISLEEYELAKRRHDDNMWLQIAMAVISGLLVLLAGIQAGLLKCPVLLDFTK